MSCAAWVASVENALNDADGVVKAEVNYANSSVKIEYKKPDLNADTLKLTLNG